jgi:ATP-dependent Lhr-like helicase
MAHADQLLEHLLTTGWLHSDEGLLSPGVEAERTIGKRNFLELTSVFVSDPLVSVRQGRTEIGVVPDVAITAAFAMNGPPALLLAGRAWRINNIDWKRRIAHVEPTDDRGSVRFAGTAQPLGYEICQAIAAVLEGESIDPVTLTSRAVGALSDARDSIPNAHAGRTVLVKGEKGQRWYTFAGLRANLELAARLVALRSQVSQTNNLYITIESGVSTEDLRTAVGRETPEAEFAELVNTTSDALKLERALPEALIQEILMRRLRDRDAVDRIDHAPIDTAG